MALPEFNKAGDLPPDVYQATLDAVLERFGGGSVQRRIVAQRLVRIHELAVGTGMVRRFIIFGSFITAQVAPNDVDVFLLMDDAFDVRQVSGEAALLFDHLVTQAYFGASVFWIRTIGALGGEDAVIADWQVKRDGTRRGVVEVSA